MRALAFSAILIALAVGCAGPAPASPTAPETRPALLAALDGKWIMVGDVLGKPVKYSLSVSPILARTFTELHMIDIQQPPQYEARVFIAHDKESGQIIVHWLDVFGGKGSIPHGTGQITGNTIEFIIPYTEGPFRNRPWMPPEARGDSRSNLQMGPGAGSTLPPTTSSVASRRSNNRLQRTVR